MIFLVSRRPRIFLYLEFASGWIVYCFQKDGPPWYEFIRAHRIGKLACRVARELERDDRQ